MENVRAPIMKNVRHKEIKMTPSNQDLTNALRECEKLLTKVPMGLKGMTVLTQVRALLARTEPKGG
jgi:hypothetical protein